MDIHVSPSLRTPDRWASEVKFDVSPEIAAAVASWAGGAMTPDIHGGDSADGSYRIRTLYLDTAGRDVFLRSPGYKLSKFRVRSYLPGQETFLEQKKKRGCRVQKFRTAVDVQDFEAVVAGSMPSDHSGQWFRSEVERLQLLPSCLVEYRRFAFNSMSESGPMRLTIDDQIFARDAAGWDLGADGPRVEVMPGRCVLEIKFPEVLPAAFKEMIREHRLLAPGGSKYRFGHAALVSAPVEERRCQNS